MPCLHRGRAPTHPRLSQKTGHKFPWLTKLTLRCCVIADLGLQETAPKGGQKVEAGFRRKASELSHETFVIT